MIDGPQNGTAPGPWDIQASPPSLFQDYTQCFEVPHTASVKVSAVKLGFSLYQLTNFSPTLLKRMNNSVKFDSYCQSYSQGTKI